MGVFLFVERLKYHKKINQDIVLRKIVEVGNSQKKHNRLVF